ncbi:MAG: hypothetical protein V4477_16725 [Pseudomonadota bacterium]
MSAAPIFVGTPKTFQGALSTANTNRDGSGTITTLVTGGSLGTRIDRIKTIAAGTVTAGVVRFFLSDGTNTRLFKERLVTAITPSATVAVFEDEITFADALIIPTGWTLKASTHNAEAFNLFAHGGDI